jgi:hypothetical protein
MLGRVCADAKTVKLTFRAPSRKLSRRLGAWFHLKSATTAHPIRIVVGDLKPLARGTFELEVSVSSPCSVSFEFSHDLRDWTILEEVSVRTRRVLHNESAANSPVGFYRFRTEQFCSEALGFVNVEAAPKYNLLSYPFVHHSGLLKDILHWVPLKSEVHRFDPQFMKLRKATFQKNWEDPEAKLGNGEGFLFYNPTSSPFPITLSGRVPPEDVRRVLHSGTHLLGSMLPLAGSIEQDLNVPLAAGDSVSLFYSDQQELVEFKKAENGWSREIPNLRLAEGFWIAKNESACWVQALSKLA